MADFKMLLSEYFCLSHMFYYGALVFLRLQTYTLDTVLITSEINLLQDNFEATNTPDIMCTFKKKSLGVCQCLYAILVC